MKKELEDKLFMKYPKLFPNGRDVDIKKNLMYFGFEHGDGWYDILDELFKGINSLLKKFDKIDVVQVKEKFGTLRFYYDILDGNKKLEDDIYELNMVAIKKSSEICEVCGEDAKCSNKNGWLSTLCDKHFNKKGVWDG